MSTLLPQYSRSPLKGPKESKQPIGEGKPQEERALTLEF